MATGVLVVATGLPGVRVVSVDPVVAAATEALAPAGLAVLVPEATVVPDPRAAPVRRVARVALLESPGTPRVLLVVMVAMDRAVARVARTSGPNR